MRRSRLHTSMATPIQSVMTHRTRPSPMSELKKDGVTATLDSQGFGESKPVAPNTNADGSDNPAGRQANRRVEIFIPAF